MTQNSKPEDFVHFSQISTFLKCRKKHDFAYIERLESRGFNPKMMFGTFGHAALADMWTMEMKGTEPTVLPGELKKALENHPEFGVEFRQMAVEALNVAHRAFKQLVGRFAPLMVEQSLITEACGMNVGGTPDLVARDLQDNSIWVFDYKFRGSFMPPETELLNLQMIFYQALLHRLGIETAGTRQIQIRPFLPKEPKVNKDGSLSRADLLTDWQTYEAAIVRNGLKVEDYSEMPAKLADKKFVDIDSCRALRPKSEVEYFWQNEILPAIVAIRDRKPGEKGGRCFDQMACRTCSFLELCTEEAKGGDTEYLKNSVYRVKGTGDLQAPEMEEDV